MRIHGCLFGILAAAVVAHGAALASAQRTFVASSGSDANLCSIAAPCRSFGQAALQTNDGGEIVVLDTAGYGRVTVTQSVSIIAPPGVHAGVAVFTGTNGVDIATPGLRVVLKGLSIVGQGGLNGIYMSAASELVVERCELSGMLLNGLFVEASGATVTVRDSSSRDNGNGGFAFTGASTAMLDHVHAEGNPFTGIGVYLGPTLTVRNSTLERNDKGIEILSTSGGAGTTRVHVSEVAISHSSNAGIYVVASGPNKVTLNVVRSSIAWSANSGVNAVVQDGSSEFRALVSDTAFTGNVGGGIKAEQFSGGAMDITLTRDSFVDNIQANISTSGVPFRSGGGNSISKSDGYTPPTTTLSF